MNDMGVLEYVKTIGAKKILDYWDSDPEKNMLKIIDWLIRIDKEDKYVGPQAKAARQSLQDPDNNWKRLAMSLWEDIDDGVRKKMFENLIINATIVGRKRQDRAQEKYGCNVPWAILLDPTSACNLHCVGCWAADYGNKLSMDYHTLDRIIEQGKEIGTYLYAFSGGEPLLRKNDLIRLCKKHHDCAFMAFTNGTLIDEQFAGDMLEVKNFVPAISVEGFEEETDFRRGSGTYRSVRQAMELLKSKKLLFGISNCYTRKNTGIIGSEEYIDAMIAWGAKFAWFFTYMPVGADAVPELMATAQQREFMYRQIRAFRKTKPIFTMDFWNDAEYAEGCIAGGRRYLHINANGDMEPCAFVHYSDSNIHEKTLLEALRSPLFMQYHDNQPFHENQLRPCPLLDHPDCLVNMVEKSGAESTDLLKPEAVGDLCAKCARAAEAWGPVADKLWNEGHANP